MLPTAPVTAEEYSADGANENQGGSGRVLGAGAGKYKDNEPIEGPSRGTGADPEGSTAMSS